MSAPATASGALELPERVDLLVVGAGIHGVGVAQAAAAAGHSVLVLEERAPAAGTSSRSSKLIHGGLRYLESGQVALVRESLRERAILCRVAPELVRLVPFHVPLYRHTTRKPWELYAGLSMYAVLAGLKREACFTRVPRAEWEALDGLATDGLRSVFRYHDGQTDDAALVRAVLRSAEELGARLACPASLVEARRDERGWRVRLARGGAEHELGCAVLVNAAGPWVERVRSRLRPGMAGFALDLVGGTHVELEGTLERGVYYVEAEDRRAVFAIPWQGRVMVGTTETPWRGDPAEVAPAPAEVEYLERTYRRYFPHRPLVRVRAWAGLRVLPRGEGRAFDRPRETTLVVDDELHPRALAIYGGKLTGYRATAEKVLERLAGSLPRRERRGDTRTLRLRPALDAPLAAEALRDGSGGAPLRERA